MFCVVPIEVKDVIWAGSGKGNQTQDDDKLREGVRGNKRKLGEVREEKEEIQHLNETLVTFSISFKNQQLE